MSQLYLCVFLFHWSTAVGTGDDGKSVLCLHEIDTIDKTRFSLENFHANLCTHLVYNTIRLDIETNVIESSNILNQGDKHEKLIAALKSKNSLLKILVTLKMEHLYLIERQIDSLGNISHVDETARKVVAVLDQHKFDGIYFEFVSSHDVKSGFMNLIISLNKAFSSKGHILTYVIGDNDEDAIDQGYDISVLSKNVDLLILETYNFHDATIEPKFADHHAPLYNRPWDQENKTVDFLVNLWTSKNFPANKILLTIPLWGNSWKLSTNKTSPPAPANGKGSPGRLTSRRGFMGYFEICKNIHENFWQVFHDEDKTMGPYAVSPADTSQNQIWVGYDDPAMAVIKSEYIKTRGLGGAAVNDISYDDIDNRCKEGHYPVLTAVRNTLTPESIGLSPAPLFKYSDGRLEVPSNLTSTASSIYSLSLFLFLLFFTTFTS